MFGSHLSIAGGTHNALLEAERLGLSTVQIFTKTCCNHNGSFLMNDKKDRLLNGWCTLTRRYGADVRSPWEQELRSAVKELYGARPEDHEHNSISVRFGADDETMYVVEAYVSQAVTFSKFADQDFGELLSECTVEGFDEATLVRLLQMLSNGDIAGIKILLPACGW